MTRVILVDKLLSLGSSGEDFQGAVGGFGKAKEILYFAHQSYTINSGEWRVSGSGAGYNIEERNTHLHGRRSAVTWKGLVADRLCASFRRFIALCDRRGVGFTLDGEFLKPEITRFRCLRPLECEGKEWAHLGVTRFEENLMLVRIAGIPMFAEASSCRQSIVLELQGDSGERLTANRDSLRHPYSTRFRDLVTQMAVDRRSALKLEKPVYTRYGGPKLQRPTPAHADEAPAGTLLVAASTAAPDADCGILAVPRGRVEASASLLPHQFINKNCVNRKIPREFDPLGLKFSDHAHWLVRAWSGCLLELHDLHAVDHRFSVGFVFSEQVEAEFEKSPEYGIVYYLNPCVIAKRSIRRRWKQADRGQIAALAAHEFVHGGLGLSYHSEDFANRLTDVMGVVLNHGRRFARHFK